MVKAPRAQRNTALKWLGPLLWACVVVGLIVGVLLTIRQHRAPSPAGGPPAGGPPAAGEAGHPGKPHRPRTPRHMLPADAWAVLDVDLAGLTEAHAKVPQLLEGVDCSRVDPPERIAMSLLAPAAPAEDHFEFLVAATETSERFRACARQKMVEGDAASEAWPGGFEVLTREGGLRLILREQTGEALFANAPTHETAQLLEVLAGTGPNAAEQGHHAVLLSSFGSARGPLLTITLPDDWMNGLVTPEEASLSPLRFLRAAAWTLDERGLMGLVDCKATADGAGCKTLARFIEDSRRSLLAHLSNPQQNLLRGEWTLAPEQPTRLRLHWHLSPEARDQLLTTLLQLVP